MHISSKIAREVQRVSAECNATRNMILFRRLKLKDPTLLGTGVLDDTLWEPSDCDEIRRDK
jgi:hypothetical protein